MMFLKLVVAPVKYMRMFNRLENFDIETTLLKSGFLGYQCS